MTHHPNKFYVYEHWRPDTGVCFYVGKGCGRRKYLMGKKERNRHHFRIIRKLRQSGLSVEIRVVREGLAEEEAYAIEQERIAFWREVGMVLTNQTDGGDGLRSPMPEIRAKMSAAHDVRWTEERREKMSQQSRARWATEDFRIQYAAIRGGQPWTEKQRAAITVGLRGRKLSPDAVKRMSGSGNPFFGKRHSKELIEQIAKKNRGKKHTPETRSKMSDTRRGAKKSPDHVERMRVGRAITMLLRRLRAAREVQDGVRI